ncbi:MAG: A24 family peptidase [Selenomonadaceae bacterium]|nr:A24 family peptidase [Selenomonadaceae bacterium]
MSKLIDLLYSRETEELSFPGEIRSRAVYRLPLLFAGCAAAFFQFDTAYPLAGIFNLCFYLSLLFISITDWEQYIIFDSAVLLLSAAGIGQSLTAEYMPEYLSLPPGTPVLPPGPMEALLSGLAAGGIMLLLAVAMKGSIFGGDIKLITALGIWLGAGYTSSAVAFGFLLGGLTAAVLLIATKKKKDEFFAYGPYFAIAAAIVRATGITL